MILTPGKLYKVIGELYFFYTWNDDKLNTLEKDLILMFINTTREGNIFWYSFLCKSKIIYIPDTSSLQMVTDSLAPIFGGENL